ncbi:lysophospholipase L1-like esterase [Kibdelosporangium banguiense]|uniref:Lysophospholipase L1-like esterase n=1 Tax=Kibdelosporangium banguiense TaxID=1365924 RepID=A0ABS4TMC5_9PSEU|nr:SGNH/GDSL hydrolase family protein [Kibdelosporangium banguiense]MBP2325561.1 lysophospholipase L1-like esterase [Kibdelosporangium banguiense]
MNEYRFVALGDSFTEGVGDPGPDGTFRGWADRLADLLADSRGPLSYANLAVRGLTTRQILESQLAAAVALQPDLVTVVTGMNDLIRPKLRIRETVADLDRMVGSLAATGAQVITATLPTPAQGTPLPTPLRRELVKRLNLWNAFTRRIARTHGALCLDLAMMMPPGIGGWSDDRLHPGPDGHRAAAEACMGLLNGSPPRRLAVTEIVAADPGEPSLREQWRWARQFLVPWVKRRVRRETSSTGVVAKLPSYLTIRS